MYCLLLRNRRGIVEPLATLFAVPMFMAAICFTLYFGRALYAAAALEDAAAAGARWVSTSLSGTRGCQQTQQAMRLVIAGYYLDPAGFRFSVRPVATWGRGTMADVNVSYQLRQSNVPLFGPLLGDVPLQSHYRVPIDAFNNRYEWTSC